MRFGKFLLRICTKITNVSAEIIFEALNHELPKYKIVCEETSKLYYSVHKIRTAAASAGCVCAVALASMAASPTQHTTH